EADVGRQFSVLLAPTGAHSAVSSLYSSEDTTPDGHFIFDGLPPGSYKLYALEELDPRLVGDPELLRSLDDYGKDVELQEGGSLRLTDKLPIIRVSQLPPD